MLWHCQCCPYPLPMVLAGLPGRTTRHQGFSLLRKSSRRRFFLPFCAAQMRFSPRAEARGVGDDLQKPSDACRQPEGCGPPKRCHR